MTPSAPDARRSRTCSGRETPNPTATGTVDAARTGGFLYCVSLVGVTGARTSLPRSVGRYVSAVRAAIAARRA
ncbi:MAG: hypothetical protein WCH74_15400, partial [Chloroflexota bacterium]